MEKPSKQETYINCSSISTCGGIKYSKVLFLHTLLACLHDQYKSGSLEGRLFSNQSELFESFLNCPN